MQEEIWNKHAFLLEEDDIFFVNIPENWKVSQGNESALIYIPDKKILEDRWQTFFSFQVEPLSYEIPSLQEDFVFADGQTGKKHIADYSEQLADNNGKYIEYILSADEKYIFNMGNPLGGAWDNIQYETLLGHFEQFYSSIIFQKGQIGLPQEKELKEREKVRFHTGGYLWLEADIPEGISFEVRNTDLDYSLFFYLDETKENYVEMSNDWECEQLEDIWEMMGQMLTDQTYEESAIYATYVSWNQKISEYNFFSEEPIYVMISVPEEDEEMFEAATDIVRSIKLR